MSRDPSGLNTFFALPLRNSFIEIGAGDVVRKHQVELRSDQFARNDLFFSAS